MDLPYIDEHSISIAATPERVWDVLVRALRTDFGMPVPSPLARAWGLEPRGVRGAWDGAIQPEDSLTGFTVAEALPPRRLELRGRHRFSNYALIFELDATSAESCRLSAQTWAAFPGRSGRVYRAIVIGSGGHRLLLRRLLRRIARRA
jgi:hypothetical protein